MSVAQPLDKLSIHAFGEALLSTRDLDPLYVGLVDARLERAQLYRWLLAYWCFYHVGVASWASEREGSAFWKATAQAAANDTRPDQIQLPGERWPRGTERRHFRGIKCVSAVQTLAERFPQPEKAVEWLIKKRGDYAIMEAAQTWPMFGPWIAFKVVDMLERCAGVKAPISGDLVLMYDEPYKGLKILTNQGDTEAVLAKWRDLLDHFKVFKAPPRLDRLCGPAEVETALCKWKSYLGGHYHIGKDIHEQRAGLAGWGETAHKLLAAYPPEVARDFQCSGHQRVGQNLRRPTLFDDLL